MRSLHLRSALLLCVGLVALTGAMRVCGDTPKGFDIRPFALPNTPANEIRFESPREVERIVVTFAGAPPEGVGVSYLQKTWPGSRLDRHDPADNTIGFGWFQIDDWFMAQWKKAQVKAKSVGANTLEITFKGLSSENQDRGGFDVTYRRTLGVKIDASEAAKIAKVEVYTVAPVGDSSIRVALDAGATTPGKQIKLSAYGAEITGVTAETGVKIDKDLVSLESEPTRVFRIDLRHLKPEHPYSNDEGLVTFEMDDDTFTISLDSLETEGPIWFADEGVYITWASDNTSFDAYRASSRGRRNIMRMVTNHEEQGLGGSMNGQPRPHPVSYVVGCKHAWQNFRIEPNGDIVLNRVLDPNTVKGKDAGRYANSGEGRFFFGLERWVNDGRFPDPPPVLVYNIHKKNDGLSVEQKSLAIPLTKKIDDKLSGDDSVIGLVRFRFTNNGDRPVIAELPIAYSSESARTENRLEMRGRNSIDDNLVPLSKRDKLTISSASKTGARSITSRWKDKDVLRCTVNSVMQPVDRGNGIVLRKELKPGESCEAVLSIPFIALDKPEELAALAKLDFDKSYKLVTRFWNDEGRRGAQLKSPEPNLDALYKSHLAHVDITDFAMPEDPSLINTSVGTATYGNYCNESCMLIQELDERGLHEDARARLATWLKYQGTKALMGNFTDHDGVFFGAGGFEGGESYDQHHGWVLWYLAEHYFLTGDDAWFKSIADQVIKGVDWVARQRKVTKVDLPHSRGWEYGWLAAGALEDVDDYFYWLSTNSLTWRGVDAAARALEAINHPDAPRIRAEADDYKKCLIRGFELNRQHAPLVRLRDGRWVPIYPSRLYNRGRDIGWIREVLEGSVYLLISGLYDVNSKQAQWILDDFQDNRYMGQQWGYWFPDFNRHWFDRGGFSDQPNLLAGLIPHMDRDEPELYVWSFFNAWAACYREEINAMVEHPNPYLGWSNAAHYKTSDQANAVKWLRYMYVYVLGDTLHFGRAIPREWLSDGRVIYAEKVSTRFGDVGIRYSSSAATGKITAEANLALRKQPGKTLVRIRHPEKLPIKGVTVNGKTYDKFDPAKGDIDITGMTGKIKIEAAY